MSRKLIDGKQRADIVFYDNDDRTWLVEYKRWAWEKSHDSRSKEFLQRYRRLDSLFPQDRVREEDFQVYLLGHDAKLSGAPKSSRLAIVLRVFLAFVWLKAAVRQQVGIARPPGSLLGSLADFFCSAKTLDNVVKPLLSDMQVEYFEALAAGRNWKAAWIRLRGTWSFLKALGLFSIVKAFAEMWRKVSSG